MNKEMLPYNPGLLPAKHTLEPGQILEFEVDGFPPIKKAGVSLRNPKNPRYKAFLVLRNAATNAMNRRAWYFGPISLDVSIFYRNQDERKASLNEYVSGIMDTLDGSSGFCFTYLPIAYEDDCQVFKTESRFEESEKCYYRIKIGFH